MVRYMRLLLCIAILAAISCSITFAIPSYRGYTGLMIIPTADALCQGNWNAGVFSEDVSDTITDYVANYGISNGLEVGFDRFLRNTEFHGYADSDGAKTLLNAKYAFMPEEDGKPGVAAGIFDITNDLETTVYVIASKSFTSCPVIYDGEIISPRIHVGLGGGYFDGLFGGLSTYLGNRLQVMFEWDSKNVQIGGRFRVTPGLTVHVTGFDITDRDNTTFGAGISYGRYY